MKKLFIISLAILAALSFTSCNKLVNPSEEAINTVRFYAVTADQQTKTVFGAKEDTGYPTLWTTNRQVYLALVGGTAVRDAAVIPSADQKTAQFDAAIPQPQIKSDYVFKAISPSTAAAWTKAADIPPAVRIPQAQTPTDNSVDEDAQIMAAISETFSSFPSSVELAFSHVVAYGKFSLKNLPDGVTVQSIEISAETPIAGTFIVDYAEKTLTPVNISTSLFNTITIDPSSTTSGVYWFSLAPVDLQGQTLTFVVKTNIADYTKQVTFPSGKGNFQAGQVASFKLDMTGTGPEKDPEFALTGVTVNNGTYELGDSHLLPASGGTYTVNYTIANPGPLGERVRQIDYTGFYTDYGTWNQPLNGDKDVTVSPEHGTPVLNGEVVEGSITITVKPNTTGKDRRCRVCFVYWYQKDDGTYSNDYQWDNYGNIFIGQSAN